jgi:molybdate transport system substrate-binding protein
MLRRSLLPLLASLPVASQAAGSVTIFAAISLQDALRAMARPDWRLSFAATSALARQIEQGAPADLFLSADEAWMDWAAERRLIRPETRVAPIGNTLVLVGWAGGEVRGRAGGGAGAPRVTTLGELPSTTGRIALGDPAHVPAGRYAEQALRHLGSWPALAPRLARSENVRAALLLVERGEAPFGIVYATDALASPELRVLAQFPSASHAPIRYSFAMTTRGATGPAAREAMAAITAPAAMPIWQRHGFVLPG